MDLAPVPYVYAQRYSGAAYRVNGIFYSTHAANFCALGGPTQSLTIDLTPNGHLAASVMYYMSQTPRIPIIIIDNNTQSIETGINKSSDMLFGDIRDYRQITGDSSFENV